MAKLAQTNAGASLNREYERRMARRDERVRGRLPHLGPLLLAVFDESQSDLIPASLSRVASSSRSSRTSSGVMVAGIRCSRERLGRETLRDVGSMEVSPFGQLFAETGSLPRPKAP